MKASKSPLVLLAATYFFLALGFQLPSSQAAQQLINRLEASVKTTPILSDEVVRFRRTVKLRAQLDQLFVNSKMYKNWDQVTDPEIVGYLVNEAILAQQFPVSSTEVEQEINTIQANNRMDRAALTAALREQGFSFEDYRSLIEIGIIHRTLVDREIRPQVHVSDKDVANHFYNNHSVSANEPRAFHLELISIQFKDFKSPADAYNSAQRAKAALDAGEEFKEVAGRFNSDGSNGDLGVLTEDQMSPFMREQAKTLKIGEYSKIFGGAPTQRYMILKLMDVKSSQSDYLEKNKEQIRNQLMAVAFEQQIELWLERQKQKQSVHLAGEPTVKGKAP